jgi:plasmid stabilization system protein ParE
MTLNWTYNATDSLKGYYEYIKETKGVKLARAWRKTIFDSVEHLKSFPRHGRQESSNHYPEKEFRSILQGNYRIIYEVKDQEVIVHLVFDTRQNPDKLNF